MACSAVPYIVLLPLLLLISLIMALNALWLLPLAALLGFLFRTKRIDPVPNGHVVITGGSSGIGLAVAKLCAARGAAKVTLVARNQSRLENAKAVVLEAAANRQIEVEVVSLDCCTSKQREVDDALREACRRVDLLVCSAGDSGQPEVFEKITEDSWETMLHLNVLGVVKVVRTVLPAMRQQRSGVLCFIGSMAGQAGVYGLSAYSPTKFALRGLAESLRMEVEHDGISVVLANPPDTETPLLERENETKPLITKLLSEEAGTWSPEKVADGILKGCAKRRFIVGFGIDGFMLNTVTSGMAPSSGPVLTVLEVLCLPLFRLIVLWYTNWFDRVIRKNIKNVPAAPPVTA